MAATRPARPDDAGFEERVTNPLLPDRTDPELKARLPLEPQTPELLLLKSTAPLLAAVPSPEFNLARPPLQVALRPELR